MSDKASNIFHIRIPAILVCYKIGFPFQKFEKKPDQSFKKDLNVRDSFGKEKKNKFTAEFQITVKILKFGTPQTIAIIVLKIEKFDVTLHKCIQKTPIEWQTA